MLLQDIPINNDNKHNFFISDWRDVTKEKN